MPMVVDHFLREFQELVHRNVYVQDTTGFQPDPLLRQQKLEDIQTCYEIKFSHISDGYFKSQPWPHPDQVWRDVPTASFAGSTFICKFGLSRQW